MSHELPPKDPRGFHLHLVYDLLFLINLHLRHPGRLHLFSHQEILTVSNQATDDQKFTQRFAAADADFVPDGNIAPVTVTFQDAQGNDLSKWLEATPDPADPLLFSYTRKPNTDGTQPATLDFVAVGTATVNGQPITVKTPMTFVPGAAVNLTATTSVEPLSGAPVAA